MAFRLAVCNGTTGRVVGDLPFMGVPSWGRQLNDAGSLSSLQIPLPVDDDMRQRLNEPWRWIIAWANGHYIMQAGYLIKAVFDDTADTPTASLECVTMWEFLSTKRIVRYPGQPIDNAAADVLFGDGFSPDASNQGLALSGVARRIVEIDITPTDHKSYVALPIILPEIVAATPGEVRTYTASDNTTVGDALTDLSQITTGPEMEFSPRWSDDSQSGIIFRMRIGNPRLGQLGYPHAWDYQQACTSFPITVDGTDMTFYLTEVGRDSREPADKAAGTPASGTLVWAQGRTDFFTSQGWPDLMTFDTTHSDETQSSIINNYAVAGIATGQNPVYTGFAVIRNDGLNIRGLATGSPDISQVSVGDTGVIQVVGHPGLTNGKYAIRILEMTGGEDLYSTVLTLQVLGPPS